MARVKGKTEFDRHNKCEKLSRGKAIKAKCYECNGEGESFVDCNVPKCPLYNYSPYKGVRDKNKEAQKLDIAS